MLIIFMLQLILEGQDKMDGENYEKIKILYEFHAHLGY